jgi:Phage integrase, N-terminal SAM-like domain
MSETNTVSPLRQRMIEDIAARKLNPHTQRGHINSCKRFAAWLKRSPDTATPDEVRRFQLLLAKPPKERRGCPRRWGSRVSGGCLGAGERGGGSTISESALVDERPCAALASVSSVQLLSRTVSSPCTAEAGSSTASRTAQ